MRKPDVILQLVRHLGRRFGDLLLRQQQISVVLVEFLGVFQRGGITPLGNVGQYCRHGFANLACV